MPLRAFHLSPVSDLALLRDVPVLEALQQAIPPAVIRRTLVRTDALDERRRRLPAELVVALVIALGLWTRDNVRSVLATLVDGLRNRDPVAWLGWHPPAKSSLTQARQRLGVRPLRELFGCLARPLATPDLPGAFRFGRRLMAIDGTTLATPDTPANVRAFGRPAAHHGAEAWTTTRGAFPLVRLLLLVECGTHAICDVVLRPFSAGEAPAARRLLRSVAPGMLVLWDRGLHSFAMLRDLRAKGADFLGRVGQAVVLAAETELPDGSFRARVYASPTARRRKQGGIPVRVIEYRIDDPARPRQGERYRLITSLLDPAQAPATDLAYAYHERWEQESVHDELKTHQADRRPAPPLRSRRPREVIQEVYGLLLAHWAIRRLMADAAASAGLDPDVLSFSGALQVLRRAIPRFQQFGDQPDLTPLCSPPSGATLPPSAFRPAVTATTRAS